MGIRVNCPSCENSFKVDDDLAGKKIRCPECKESVKVPAAAKASGKKDEGISERASASPKANGKARKRDDDDRDDERPKRKSVAKKGGGMMLPLLLGGGALVLLMCVGGGVGAFFLFGAAFFGAKGNARGVEKVQVADAAKADVIKQADPQPDKQPPPVVNPQPQPDDPPTKKGGKKKNPDNPVKAGPELPILSSAPGNVIKPDWSAARRVDLVPADTTWKIAANAAPEMKYKPVPVALPDRRNFWEGCNAFVVNPVAKRALVAYGWNEKGKSTTRFLFCDVENGKVVSQFVMAGTVSPAAINDEGTQGLFRRDKNNKTMLEIWSLSDKGAVKTFEFSPADSKDRGHDIRLAVFLDSKRLLTASYHGKVVVWDMPAVKPLYFMETNGMSVPALSADRKRLAFISGEQVGVIDVDAGKVLAMQPTPPYMPFPSMSISPSGKWIACAVMNRIVIWDAATGKLHREIPDGGGGYIPWVSDKHILRGNNTLLDIEMPYAFWEYHGQNQVQISHGLAWFVTTEGNQGAITTAVLPQPAVLQAYTKGVTDLVLKPGTVVKIDVSALPDKAEAADVAKMLEEKLGKIGCTAGPNGAIELVAYADTGKEVEMGFVSAKNPPKKKGPGKGPNDPPEKARVVSIREHFARLKFVSQGKELWKVSGDNLPKTVSLAEGETLDEHMKKLERPPYAFYQTVELPRLLLQSGGSTILGKTQVTNSGVR